MNALLYTRRALPAASLADKHSGGDSLATVSLNNQKRQALLVIGRKHYE